MTRPESFTSWCTPLLARQFCAPAWRCAILLSATITALHAQPRITIRPLGPIEAAATDTLGLNVILRPLSDGTVLVNDADRARILKFDSALKHADMVQQFAKSAATFSLIPFTGDSSLSVDYSSRSLIVLDADGKIARVMAMPHLQDIPYLSTELLYGKPVSDGKGRLLYRGITAAQMTTVNGKYLFSAQSDSAPIVRVDFEARTVDTIARVRLQDAAKYDVKEDARGTLMLTITVNPLYKVDQWAMLTSGTIAIVRAQDYHVDFIDSNGTMRSAERMPFDWLRLTDGAKQKKVDSLQAELDQGSYAAPSDVTLRTADGPLPGKRQYAIVPARELPDYDSALAIGSVKADLDNHLWILPRTSNDASDAGLVYDIVSSAGVVTERVRIPRDRVLAGFGPNGAVFLIRVDAGRRFLERVRMR